MSLCCIWVSLKDEPNTSKMSPMSNDIGWPMRNLLHIVHHAPMNGLFVHQAIQYHWILDGFPYRKYYIVVLRVCNKSCYEAARFVHPNTCLMNRA